MYSPDSNKKNHLFIALMAFNTASTITPTSAKIASHMFAMPNAPNSRHAVFTPKAMMMFCHTIPIVR